MVEIELEPFEDEMGLVDLDIEGIDPEPYEGCWTSYDILSHERPEGKFRVNMTTNDANDSGIPGNFDRATLFCDSWESVMEITCGGSHRGWLGTKVIVRFDGKEI